ncbi:hypothetical protein [Kutzneria kofuensis]|uniref:Uncharacterized protein n=1 Tax=Kutzneria kofuensis TaxID=103725 RepID=A0A7W9NJI3_9PSEU|nr:hypothetical protein [Kutzneria kofuensis]
MTVHRAVDGTTVCTVHDGLAQLADVLVAEAPDERTAHRLARETLADHPAGVLLFVLPDNGFVVAVRGGATFTVHTGRSLVDQLALVLHAMWSSR